VELLKEDVKFQGRAICHVVLEGGRNKTKKILIAMEGTLHCEENIRE
jgi:hypothetical protein